MTKEKAREHEFLVALERKILLDEPIACDLLEWDSARERAYWEAADRRQPIPDELEEWRAKRASTYLRALRQAGRSIPPSELIRFAESDYLDGWVRFATVPRKGAKTTSPQAARELCAVAVVCLEHNLPIPEQVRHYLAKALRKGIDGASVDRALGIKRWAGQSVDPMDQDFKERAVAGHIARRVDLGWSEAKAKESACATYDLDTRRVEQIWQKHRPSEEELEYGRYLIALASKLPVSETK
jgi:hypothetical protein